MTAPRLPPGYPLAWPEGWARTPFDKRATSTYRISFAAARDDVLRQLRLLGSERAFVSERAVITANLPLRLDGLPLAGGANPADPGVAIWWIDGMTGALRTMACDGWVTARENLRAIGLALEALRALERARTTQVLDRAMQSFDVPTLPPERPWWYAELELRAWPPSAADVAAAWARLRVQRHPDGGGSHEAFIQLQRAHAQALKDVVNGRAQAQAGAR